MTAIVNRYGKLLFLIEGNAETIALNTPVDCVAVPNPPRHPMRHNGSSWEELPPSPGAGYEYSYEHNAWIDNRTLPEVRSLKWNAIKEQRDTLEFGGFEYAGNVYDSDQVSQGRIMGAALAGEDQVWTLADNTTAYLTADELKELYAALQLHVAAAHERGRIAREKLDKATTIEEVESIVF